MTPEQGALLRDAEIFDENGEGLESLVYLLARELRAALANRDTAYRAGQESMRERAAKAAVERAWRIGHRALPISTAGACAAAIRALPVVDKDNDATR